MLSRVADSLYWMSRYLERAENTVRQLDVTMGLMLDTGAASAETRWRRLVAALGKPAGLPRIAAPAEIVARTPGGAALSAGTGDNMGAALGLGLGVGEVVVSIGTSGTAYAVAAGPAADETGAVAGFADATGRFLPLVATINAARVLTVTARMLGTDVHGLDRLALAAPPGSQGLTLLPYLDGERSPNRPDASGVLCGLTSTNTTQENLARAAVEAVLCSLADAIDNLADCGITAQRVILIGGAARSPAVRAIAPAIFGVPVTVPEPAGSAGPGGRPPAPPEWVARGAARQAAWALSGAADPPAWPLAGTSAEYTAEPVPLVRERYATLRGATVGWGAAGAS